MTDRKLADLRLVHGARSHVVKRADVRRIERAVASQSGVRLRDMTGTQRRYLRLYAEARRLVDRLEPIGPIDEGSLVNGNMPSFIAALNAAGRALERFEASMGHAQQQRSQQAILDELARYRRPG